MEAPAQLAVSLVGQYSIERQIGSGRMAAVFLARDVKHDRKVALKVLNPELGAVVGVERFLAEIRVTATLQHPNLVPLFDSGEASGLLYYVMPYIEGETLRARLERQGELPIDEALSIAIAVAGALDYAHARGIIHRDLKPENILLQHGQPIVADFGIALAVSNAAGARITSTGVALGTPQYMSPEQVTADHVVDHRTDIYSLGAVVYEMLTGEPTHSARTTHGILNKVLTDPIRSVRSVRPAVPAQIDDAVMRALEKRPADRWQSAHDFAEALRGRLGVVMPEGVVTPAAVPPSLVTPAPVRARTARWPLALAFAVGIATTIGGVAILARSRGESMTFNIDPMYRGVPQAVIDFELSPDGRTIALVAGSDSISRLFLRRFSDPDVSTAPIAGADGASFCAFSPDGRWLAVTTSDARLLKIRVDGSLPPLTLAQHIDPTGGVTWADDRTIILGNNSGGLQRIAATGGAVRPLTQPLSPVWGQGFPIVGPDHKTLIFTDWGPGFTEDDFLAIGSVESGKYRRTGVLAERAIGIIGDRILYVAGGSIMAVHFDAGRLALVGDPVRVAENISTNYWRAANLSASGTLAYRRGQPVKRLVFLDAAGWTDPASSDEVKIWTGGRFSPKGDRIALDIWRMDGDTSRADIWTLDLKTRQLSRVTVRGDVIDPSWTADGTRLVFTTWYERNPALWVQTADGSTPAKLLARAAEGTDIFGASAVPDGSGALFCQGSRFTPAPKTELFFVRFAADSTPGTPERVVDDPMGDDCGAAVSPNGRWLAFVAEENGRPRIFVRPFRSPGARVEVSQGNGVRPTWSRDGARVFYAYAQPDDDRRVVMAAHLGLRGRAIAVESQERIATLLRTNAYDVSPDGKTVLTTQELDNRMVLVVTTNWLPQLRARLAGRR